MIPAFCGLAPAMADQLVAAFEEHERKIHAKELEDAENERKLQISEDGDLGPERGFTLSKDLLKKVENIELTLRYSLIVKSTPYQERMRCI